MLEWTVRWGVPLALVAAFLIFGDPRTHAPGQMAQQALDVLRDTLTGLIPRFF
jgi:hypothetical protein